MLRPPQLPLTGLVFDKGTDEHTRTSEEVSGQNRKLNYTPKRPIQQKDGGKGGKEGRTHTHTHLSVCESYLDSLYPESQGSC